MTNEELAELEARISNLEAQLAILREQLAAELARRSLIVRVRQVVTFDDQTVSGGITLFGAMAQSTTVHHASGLMGWQVAVDQFGEGLYTAVLADDGRIAIERDESTPAIGITRNWDLVAVESCLVEVEQAGIAQGPDSDPPGQAEVIVLNLGDPVDGYCVLARDGNVIPPPIRFDTVASAIGAEIAKLPGWSGVQYLDITNQQQPPGPPWIRRLRFDSNGPVAPGSWSLVPADNDPLVKICNVSFT